MNIIVSVKCNDVGKMLCLGVHGCFGDDGFTTPWRVEYHFYREVQTERKQAWRENEGTPSRPSEVDRDDERQRRP